MRAHNDKAADVINLKISKFGGITKLKQVCGVCIRKPHTFSILGCTLSLHV